MGATLPAWGSFAPPNTTDPVAGNPGANNTTDVVTVQAKHLDPARGVTTTQDIAVRVRSGPVTDVFPAEVSDGIVGGNSLETMATGEVPIYANIDSPDYSKYYAPGAGYEVLDYGTSAGGTVTRFTFAYVTTLADPGTIDISFYSGTDANTCPGNPLRGWSFSTLAGSSDGRAYWFSYDVDIPPGLQFELPAGAFGYSYEFDNADTGCYLASGGAGNENRFWQDCVSYWFNGDPWAGFYMVVYAEQVGPEHCYMAPQHDFTIYPSGSWQLSGAETIGTSGCRIYEMYLYAGTGYDFSVCANDGVGGTCSDDGDFTLYDASGIELWYIDGQVDCGFNASTLGTAYESWSPPADGLYYLKVSEYLFQSMIYNLAYKFNLPPEIRIEPESLNFDCATIPLEPQSMQSQTIQPCSDDAALPCTGDVGALASGYLATVASDKLVDSEQIMQGFAAGKERVKVIVNLKQPTQLRARTNWKSAESLKKLRQEIAARQDAVLATLESREFAPRRRFANQAGFSCEVSRQALNKLANNPDVASIEPVRQLEPHLNQGIPLIKAATHRPIYNGAGVAIAICDTGIDPNHPKLGGGSFPNGKIIGGFDFGDNDPNPIPNGDAHGTACAGIAAGDLGATGDYIGGVAYNAKLYALKIEDSSGTIFTDYLISAWDWCVSHKDDDPCHPILAISNSVGGGRFFSFCDGPESALATAADNAVAAGITVLVSSGNNGYCDSLASPACLSNVISVGAVYDADIGLIQWCVSGDSCADIVADGNCSTGWRAVDDAVADMVTAYSNTASFLDILAPSNHTYTTDIAGPDGYVPGDYLAGFGGTSASCPYAAGAVASLQSASMALTGRYLLPFEVKAKLIDTADPITDGRVAITKGRINLAAAINSLECSGSSVTIFNEGGGPLDISDITVADGNSWLSFTPAPPFTIPAGGNVILCVEVDCNSCQSPPDLNEQLLVFSNDPNHSLYPDGIYVNVTCSCCQADGDFDHNCRVDLEDFTRLASHWLTANCDPGNNWCAETDLDYSTLVELSDLLILTQNWLDDLSETCGIP